MIKKIMFNCNSAHEMLHEDEMQATDMVRRSGHQRRHSLVTEVIGN